MTLEELNNAYLEINEYDIINIVKRIKDGDDSDDLKKQLHKAQLKNMVDFIFRTYGLDNFDGLEHISLKDWYNTQKPIGYRGMVNEKETSNELRLSSVEKGIKPICYISYDKDAYTQHCRIWKEYQDWVKHRNPVRYESNLNKNYDAKNMCQCFRLINNGIEIARGEGYKVDRTGIDADFLLKVKNHGYEYDELMEMLVQKNAEMEEAVANSTIPDEIDVGFVNDLLVNIRKKQLGING